MKEFNVVTLGGKGSGKTSVLALMEQTEIPGLTLTKKDTDDTVFSQKRQELEVLCANCAEGKTITLTPGAVSSQKQWTYDITREGKSLGYQFNVRECKSDFESMDGINAISGSLKQSDVILITVDVPALHAQLEGPPADRMRFAACNKIKEITMLMKRSLTQVVKPRLVMFVPVKCDHCYEQLNMKSVREDIKEGYMELIDFLREEEGKKHNAVAIVPVVTVRGMAFERFDGNFAQVYKRIGNFAPRYSDQPLLLAVQHMLCLAQKDKAGEGFLKKSGCQVSAQGLVKIKREIGEWLDKSDSLAFELMQDPLKLNIRRKLADFNILMFGSRRTGKTSILASMVSCFEALKHDLEHQIMLKPTEDTKRMLDDKVGELRRTFENVANKEGRWTISENKTDASYEFEFEMKVKESPKTYTVNFMDIPGEWLKDSERERRLVKELNNCQIIMIAVDTPHLMEGNGAYHEAFNITKNVTGMIKKIDDWRLRRMFLLVPVKCEKYYYENRMDEVRDKIKEKYEILFKEIAKGSKRTNTKHIVAITPILTMGGVVFDDFGRTANGVVETEKEGPLKYRPKAAYYKLYQPKPYFSPQYCEQPVLYLLCFILNTAKLAGRSGAEKLLSFVKAGLETLIRLFGYSSKSLLEIWTAVFRDTKLLESAEKARQHLKTEGDGYEFIQNSL